MPSELCCAPYPPTSLGSVCHLYEQGLGLAHTCSKKEAEWSGNSVPLYLRTVLPTFPPFLDQQCPYTAMALDLHHQMASIYQKSRLVLGRGALPSGELKAGTASRVKVNPAPWLFHVCCTHSLTIPWVVTMNVELNFYFTAWFYSLHVHSQFIVLVIHLSHLILCHQLNYLFNCSSSLVYSTCTRPTEPVRLVRLWPDHFSGELNHFF